MPKTSPLSFSKAIHAPLMMTALCALLLGGCASSGGAVAGDGALSHEAVNAKFLSSEKLTAADYQPLGIGNRWTYRGTMLGQELERTITTLGIENGFFVDDANGRLKIEGDGLRDDKRFLLKAPLEKGQKWMAILSPTSTEHYEIMDTGASVTTPAGRFEGCLVVQGTNRIDGEKVLETQWFYAPGIGIVRMSTALRDGDKVIPQADLGLSAFRIEGR